MIDRASLIAPITAPFVALLALFVRGAPVTAAQAGPSPLSVTVEIVPPRAFVGEAIEVSVRVSFDEAWFADHALQPFQQPLGLPLQLLAPALLEWRGTLARAPGWSEAGESPPPQALSFALCDRRVAAIVRFTDGHGDLVLRRTFLATAPGPLEFAPASALVSFTSGFDDDLLAGRAPRDRRELRVESPGQSVIVDALPDAGRPPGFGGAVGTLTLGAELSASTVELGQPITLTATIRGAANFEQFAPPAYAPTGFHVRGKTVARARDAMTLTFELLAESTAIDAVPSLAIDWFEPAPAPRYRRSESGALAFGVRPAADGRTTLLAPAPAVDPALLELLAPLRALDERRARPGSSWFERAALGRRACRDGDHAAAERWYAAALTEEGAPHGALLANLGHARFAQGQFVLALADWLDAAIPLSGDRDLAANVDLAARRLNLGTRARASLRDWCEKGGGAGRHALVIAADVRGLASPSTTSTPLDPSAPPLPVGTLIAIDSASPRYVELARSAGWLSRTSVRLLAISDD
ncbi:MAG: hypothetical protein EXS13_08910 [Planctomycetes bacterium]|nr:hypothetical protein [Planctomycetota bacterium]